MHRCQVAVCICKCRVDLDRTSIALKQSHCLEGDKRSRGMRQIFKSKKIFKRRRFVSRTDKTKNDYQCFLQVCTFCVKCRKRYKSILKYLRKRCSLCSVKPPIHQKDDLKKSHRAGNPKCFCELRSNLKKKKRNAGNPLRRKFINKKRRFVLVKNLREKMSRFSHFFLRLRENR